jgi:hypothetical protein
MKSLIDPTVLRSASVCALIVAVMPAWSQAAASAPAAGGASSAAAACEKAARETLRNLRGSSADATFAGAPALPAGSESADEVTLRGQGRYRIGSAGAPQSFSYSCTVNLRSAQVAGVVLRDAAPAPPTAPTAAAADPDLMRVSPEACDAAAAGALKRRWPQATQVSFNGDARRVEVDASGDALMSGQGTAIPSPGQPATHFSYRCDIDPRTGRIASTRIGS